MLLPSRVGDGAFPTGVRDVERVRVDGLRMGVELLLVLEQVCDESRIASGDAPDALAGVLFRILTCSGRRPEAAAGSNGHVVDSRQWCDERTRVAVDDPLPRVGDEQHVPGAS
jgi:hypothetical protein